jgi:hypothetical protein
MDATTPIVAIEPRLPERSVRGIGAALAAVIALCIATTGGALKPDDQGWLLGVLGFPAATILAWRTAPRVMAETTKHGVARRATWFGVRTIAWTEAAIFGLAIIVLGLASLVDQQGQPLAWILFLAAYGFVAMVVSGVAVAVIVIPAAILWAALLRIAAR